MMQELGVLQMQGSSSMGEPFLLYIMFSINSIAV